MSDQGLIRLQDPAIVAKAVAEKPNEAERRASSSFGYEIKRLRRSIRGSSTSFISVRQNSHAVRRA